ncbi:MAG: choice-of-anchor J domain-containing protein, partial [Candidatus Cloacimonetes bacterium]|nr:choice-of-anchor J domain-containing protein [Candidatus Cloacimonadota bacterium]
DRAMEGYKVWRLLQGQESNEAQWTALTPTAITTTAHQDDDWSTLPDGMYRWAVKAIYTGGALSNSAFSNTIERMTQIGTISGFVRDEQNQAISGATVSSGDYSATTNANGAYSFMMPAGTHTVTASHPNYTAVSQEGIIVVTDQITTVNFVLPPSEIILSEGFETYEDFSLEFAPWTLVDVDGSNTYGITNTAWLNAYAPQAFIIFNPANTTPPVTSAEAHGGAKFAACFASTEPPNDDWIITPQINGGGEITFWAKSYVDTYGLERFKIGVSQTGTDPANFTYISEGTYVEVPAEWTEYTYSLADYEGLSIYVGINCVSNDAFFLLIDDVTITGPSSNPDGLTPALTTQLKGNYPNPFNPETTISYSVKDSGPVSIDIFNVKGQLVRKLVNDTKAAGNYTEIWNGKDNNGRAVSSGIYYFKMNAGKYSSTKKMILMK